MGYENDVYKNTTKCYNNNYYSRTGKKLNRSTVYLDCDEQQVADRIKGRLMWMSDYTISQPAKSNGASFDTTSRLANAIDDMMSNPNSELYTKYFPEFSKDDIININRAGICIADMCQSDTYINRENKYINKYEIIDYMKSIDWKNL